MILSLQQRSQLHHHKAPVPKQRTCVELWPRIAKITSTINTNMTFTDSALRGLLRQLRIELKCKGKGQTIVPADPLVSPEARNCFWHQMRRGTESKNKSRPDSLKKRPAKLVPVKAQP